MSWWHPYTPHRTDDKIAAYVTAEVKAGRIPLELAQRVEQVLRDEADGKTTVMRDPKIRPRPPKKPSWSWD
jgi:hypothetical protein